MTDTRPLDPFVPAHVNLRDFPFMPLHGDTLLDSETWVLCDAEQKVAALTLWWKSWHQVPATSLPADDRLLAALAGYGVAIKAWRAVKEMALRGWVLCSDGRYYHRFLARLAAESWLSKLVQDWKQECDRVRKANKQREEKGQQLEPIPERPRLNTIGFPADITTTSVGKHRSFRRKASDEVTEGDHPDDGTPPESSSIPSAPVGARGKGQGQGQGQGQGLSEPDGSSAGGAAAPLPVVDPKRVIFGDCLAWLMTASGRPEATCRTLLGRWVRDHGDPAVIQAFQAASRDPPAGDAVAWIEGILQRGERVNGSGHGGAAPRQSAHKTLVRSAAAALARRRNAPRGEG